MAYAITQKVGPFFDRKKVGVCETVDELLRHPILCDYYELQGAIVGKKNPRRIEEVVPREMIGRYLIELHDGFEKMQAFTLGNTKTIIRPCTLEIKRRYSDNFWKILQEIKEGARVTAQLRRNYGGYELFGLKEIW